MKKIKLLVISCILGTSLLASTPVFATSTAMLAKDSAGNSLQYDLNAIVKDAIRNALGLSSPLFEEFNTRKVIAFYDDKTGYVDAAAINNAAINAVLNGTSFDLDAYTESATGNVIITPSGSIQSRILGDDGIVKDGGVINPSGVVIATVQTVSAAPIPGQTIVIVSLPSGIDPTQYTVTVYGTELTYKASTGKFAGIVAKEYSSTKEAQADLVLSKKDTNSTITIKKIDNIIKEVNQNDSYILPSTVQATMSDGSTKNVAVSWDKIVDTSKIGTFTFNGTVSGYSSNVILTLTINKSQSPLVNSVSIQPAETYEFDNTSNSTASFTYDSTNTGIYDYVSYNRDNSVYDTGLNKKTGYNNLPSIPAGGRLIITASNSNTKNSLNCVLPSNNSITSKISGQSALTSVSIQPGESYEFDNISNSTAGFTCDTTNIGIYDCVVYNRDNSIYDTSLNKKTGYSNLPSIPAGGKLIITASNSNTKNSLNCVWPNNNSITPKITSQSALITSVSIQPGESYEFDNITNSTASFTCDTTNIGIYDFVVYNRDNSIYDTGLNKKTGYSNLPSIPAGGKLIITASNSNTKNSLNCVWPNNNSITPKITNQNALITSVSIQPGESYEFDNITNSTAGFTCDTTNIGVYDFVVYNRDNSIYDTGLNKKTGYSNLPSIPAGGKLIVTASNSNTKNSLNCIWPNNNSIVPKISSQIALASVSMQPGESYEFDNINNSTAGFTCDTTNIGMYNYVVYNRDNSIYDSGLNKKTGYSNLPSIPAGGKLIITASNSNIKNSLNCVWPNNNSIVPKISSQIALASVSIQPGESYEFDNISNSTAGFTCDTTNIGVYDYVVYNRDNSIHDSGLNKKTGYNNLPSIPAGGRLVITASSSNTKNSLNCVWTNNGSIVPKLGN